MNKPATSPTRGLAGGLSGRKLLVSSAILAAPLSLLAQTASEPDGKSTSAAAGSDEVVILSPFEVVSDNRGYYGATTMSGTRFNTKLEDLASSISVVTKGQMVDFAMLDINDVFLYTAGTEGTGTYTDVVIDRNGSASDNVQLNPNQANRVRGIASANIAFNNIETQNRTPIDPIILDSLEISRGPNASVFGLGNPSGTVNQVGASANLSRNFIQVGLRADDRDGYRQSLDVNRMLIDEKLALRFSQVFNHEGFTLKPSGVDTERYNFMVKYRPFKNTTISAAYYGMHSYGNRPNSLAPRDGISYWESVGSPTWNSATNTITKSNGTTTPGFTITPVPKKAPTYKYVGGDYFNTTGLGYNHSQLFIDENGTITNWVAPAGVSNADPATGNPSASPTSATQYVQASSMMLEPTTMAGLSGTGGRASAKPLWVISPSITDKSIYDWSSVNLAAPNRQWDKSKLMTAQLDQIFVNTARQTLAAQFTYLREESKRYTRNFIGIANDNGLSGVLTVDINEKLPDGTANPYFLRTYISTDKPRTEYSTWNWDTFRGQMAYRYDFSQNKDWSKWLGSHQITGYAEYKSRINRVYSYRDVFTSNNSWMPSGLYRANQSQVTGTPTLIGTTQSNYRFYVGDNSGHDVDYSPTAFSYGTYDYVWGNSATKVFNHEASTLGLGASTDKTGGTANLNRIIKTQGAVLQSRFLKDAVIATYGVRNDDVFDVFGQSDASKMMNADGLTFNYDGTDAWDPKGRTLNSGRTTNTQLVVRPFKNFTAFERMEKRGGVAGFFGDLLSDMSIGGSKSDSFLPEQPAQDLFLNVLPNSTGKDKSYTVRFDLFNSKLNVSVTNYVNKVMNTRNGDANTICQRVLRTDVALVGATPAKFLLAYVAGATTANSTNSNRIGWIKAQNPTWTDAQVAAELANVMGMSTELMNTLINPTPPLAATNDIEARGTEIEVNFNPTSNWTVAGSFDVSKTTNKNISSAIQTWIDMRMPIWTKLVDPTLTDADCVNDPANGTEPARNPKHLWWNHVYPGASGSGLTAAVNFESFVRQPYAVIQALEGQSNPQYSKYKSRVSTNYKLRGISSNSILKKMNVGGAVRWQSKQAIGYCGATPAAGTTIITDVDTSRPIWDKAYFYFDAFVGYHTEIFNDKVGLTLQLNVKNIQESGRLQPVGAYPDASMRGIAYHTYRIIEPRQFILSATFDL